MKTAFPTGIYDGAALEPLANYIRRWARRHPRAMQDSEREASLLAIADRVQGLASAPADVDLRSELVDIAARLRTLTFYIPPEMHHTVLLRRSFASGHVHGDIPR